MPDIKISVKNKTAIKTDPTVYVCGNSDFIVKFDFDIEWETYDSKTARFSYDGRYIDVVFGGNECQVPIISDTYSFHVGVYAGNLHTTTPARVSCKKSILCGGGLPADPPPDVYAQIMALLNNMGGSGGNGSSGGTFFVPDETLSLKDGVLSVNRATEVEQDNTLPITSAAVAATVGNIEILLKTI